MKLYGHDITPYDDNKITSPCGEWEVGFHILDLAAVDNQVHTGWFEWVGGDNSDPECAGELIFEIHPDRAYLLELVDYDGVFALPQQVAAMLIQHGVFVSSDYIDGEDE